MCRSPSVLQLLHEDERSRGLDCVEDLASPGIFAFDLSSGAAMALTAGAERFAPSTPHARDRDDAAIVLVNEIQAAERARRAFPSALHRAADTFLVARGSGRTIVAGYPWFTDWGRDTFIAMRGLCITTGRLTEARDILLAWSGAVSEGMLPNRFPDRGDSPEFNSVDASLWYAIAVHDFLNAVQASAFELTVEQRCALQSAVNAILDGYSRGTRYRIRADADGLLACGEAGVQLTWMDSKIGDWVVTPRTGKPVEIQALWLNALWVAGHWTDSWQQTLAAGLTSISSTLLERCRRLLVRRRRRRRRSR